MKETTYTIVIEDGYRLVADFHYPDIVVMTIGKIFGKEKADSVKEWIATAHDDCTYKDDNFYIHCLHGI